MKLDYSYQEFAQITGAKIFGSNQGEINTISFDSRKIFSSENGLFLAIKTENSDGHQFILDAYEKGIRAFLISEECDFSKDSTYFLVDNVIEAVQNLAKYHRNRFSLPTIAITGSIGKTMVKEWLYAILKHEFYVVRSPKSYNSQLGVALSVLEIKEHHTLAIFEAGISHPNEMDVLEDIIQPTLGVFTGIGKANSENFADEKEHVKEKLKLFKNCNFTFADEAYHSPLRRMKINAELMSLDAWQQYIPENFTLKKNLGLCFKVAEFLGKEKSTFKKLGESLTELVGRLETAKGTRNNLIINDTYNIDIDALEQALTFQFSSGEKNKKVVVLDIQKLSNRRKQEIRAMVEGYSPDYYFEVENGALHDDVYALSNCSILFKGSHNSFLSKEVNKFLDKKHQTWITYDLVALKENLNLFESKVAANTILLCMVKASSYGSGDVKLAHFLQNNGIKYLGVAYADEGVALRNSGVTLPILVLNAQEEAFEDIIDYNLEPAIFGFRQLDIFIKALISKDKWQFPVHIKFDTGMHRLGFNPKRVESILETVQGQPEIKIKGVYSHLSNADQKDDSFTKEQLSVFETIKKRFEVEYDYNILFHVLNSHGVQNYSDYSYDMVRLGIGMFGIGEDTRPIVSWFTRISQIKSIAKGEFVGYGKVFQAEKDMKIAVLPVGYADGLARNFGGNNGQLFIRNTPCDIVGNICMDMLMIDVTHLICRADDKVEILGPNQSIQTIADKMNTIPYEVLTSIGGRVKRIYLEE